MIVLPDASITESEEIFSGCQQKTQRRGIFPFFSLQKIQLSGNYDRQNKFSQLKQSGQLFSFICPKQSDNKRYATTTRRIDASSDILLMFIDK